MLWQMDHNITNSCANAFQRFINGWSHDCFAPFAVSIVVTRVDVVTARSVFFFFLDCFSASHPIKAYTQLLGLIVNMEFLLFFLPM